MRTPIIHTETHSPRFFHRCSSCGNYLTCESDNFHKLCNDFTITVDYRDDLLREIHHWYRIYWLKPEQDAYLNTFFITDVDKTCVVR